MAHPINQAALLGGHKSLVLRGRTTPLGPQLTSFKPFPDGLPVSGTCAVANKPGMVIDGVDFFGHDLSIEADNVTVRNSRFNAIGYYTLNNLGARRGLIVELNLFDGEKKDVTSASLFASEAPDSVFRQNVMINAPTDYIIMVGGRVERNAVQGGHFQTGAHQDGFTIGKSYAPLVLFENYLDLIPSPDGLGNPNAAIKIVAHFGDIDDILVEGNVLLGGGYNVYCGPADGHGVNNVRFIDNWYGLSVYSPGKEDGFIVGGGKSPENGTNFHKSGNVQYATAPEVVSIGGDVPAPEPGKPVCVSKPVIWGGTKVGEEASTNSGLWEDVTDDWEWSWDWRLNDRSIGDTYKATPQQPGELIVNVTAKNDDGATTVQSDPVTVAAGDTPVPPNPDPDLAEVAEQLDIAGTALKAAATLLRA